MEHEENIAELQFKINHPLRELMLKNLLTDKEKNCGNRDGDLQKDDENAEHVKNENFKKEMETKRHSYLERKS